MGLIGKKAIFKTKFECDKKYNNKECKIIDYLGNDMYLIEFKNKKQLRVYDTEIIILEW